MKSYSLWDYTSDEIKTMAPNYVAIQPVAAVEQHGPHLPLGTDSLIANAFVEHLRARLQAENFPGLLLPLMPYGKSNEHLNYPGTVTYSAQTYLNVLLDIGRSCARAGFQALVFVNAHGGNRELLDVAVREIRIETGLSAFSIQPSILPKDRTQMGCEMSPEELRFGIHAGRVETAAILHLHPELVHMEKRKAAYPTCFDGCRYLDFSGKVSRGWMTQDVSETGAVGDPTGSTPEEGAAWLSCVTDELFQALLEIVSFRRTGG